MRRDEARALAVWCRSLADGDWHLREPHVRETVLASVVHHGQTLLLADCPVDDLDAIKDDAGVSA